MTQTHDRVKYTDIYEDFNGSRPERMTNAEAADVLAMMKYNAVDERTKETIDRAIAALHLQRDSIFSRSTSFCRQRTIQRRASMIIGTPIIQLRFFIFPNISIEVVKFSYGHFGMFFVDIYMFNVIAD